MYKKPYNTRISPRGISLPDGHMLTQLGKQPQRWIQLFKFIVSHVGPNHYGEPSWAARVHTSHYPILWKCKSNWGLKRSYRAKEIKLNYFITCYHES